MQNEHKPFIGVYHNENEICIHYSGPLEIEVDKKEWENYEPVDRDEDNIQLATELSDHLNLTPPQSQNTQKALESAFQEGQLNNEFLDYKGYPEETIDIDFSN